MAEVAIPVVVDIEGAFRDAAARVSTAMKPLKQEIEKETAGLRLNVAPEGFEDYRSLESILKTTKEVIGGIDFSMDHLINALSNAKQRLNELYTTSAKNGGQMTDKQRETNRALQEAIVLLETEIEARTRAGNLVSEEAKRQIAVSRAIADGNAALGKEVATMNELSEKISALRGKLLNIDPAANKDEWSETAKEIREATKQLSKYQKAYNNIVNPPKRKSTPALGSIERITRDMQKLEQQWNKMGAKIKFDPDGKLSAKAKELVKEYQNLTEQSEKYGQSLSKAASKAKPALDQTTEAMRSQNTVLKQLTSYATTYVSVFGVFRLAKQIRDVTGELEYQRVALGHLIQDEEYGAMLFERIKAAAVQSPFRIKDLVTYTKQLAAYRIETTQLFDTTKRLADISAGLGVDMNRLILAYGQVRAASVLRGQELRQFTEAGIPLVEMLAEKFTELRGTMVSTADVFKLISERAVPFSMISGIFQDLTDAGGAFYQMQETQAKTLQGRWEKLKDTFDIALQTIGDTRTFRFENDLVIKSLELLAKNLRVIPKLLSAGTVLWVGYSIATRRARIEEERSARAKVKLSAAELREMVLKRGNTALTKAYTRAIVSQRAATNLLSRSFWKLTAAMLSNPVTAIITGVAALTAAFVTFRKKTDEVTESAQKLSEWTETIERQGNIISQNDRMDTLISRYERLASKSKLTAKEQQSLSQAMRVLQGQFKEVTIEIGNANNPLKSQVDRLRDLNKTQKEAAISTLQLTKAQIELRLTELGKQEQKFTGLWLTASRQKDALSGVEKATRRQRKELKKATKDYDEYGDKLNETSGEINTLQNRLVSIDNILNPQIDTTSIDNAGDRLSKLREAISDVTNAYKKFIELQEYEGRTKALKDIGILFPSLEGWEPSYDNMVLKLEDMLNQYKGDADATRIIEQALANVKFDKIKTDIDDTLKRLTDDIKRSETIRDFYKNILGLTGDEDLATNLTVSLYGSVGKDFKDRLQEQLYRALTELEPERIDKDLMSQIMGDIAVLDIDDIKDNLEKLPPKVKEVFEKAFEDNEKYNAEWYSNFIKTYQKAKTYQERIDTLNLQRQQQREEAMRMNASQSDLDAVDEYYNREIAKVQLEALKDTYTWTKAFEDLDGVSTQTLNNLIDLIEEYIQKYGKDLEPQQLKELARLREQAKQQKVQRNAYSAIGASIAKLASRRAALNFLESKGLDTEENLNVVADNTKQSLKELAEALSEVESEMNEYINSAKGLMNVFSSDEDASFFGGLLDNLSQTVSGMKQAGLGIAQLASGIITPQAIMQTLTGLADIVSGIFSGINAAKMRRINKQIEHQQDLLDELEYSYDRLEKAMAKAFGSDYIYNYNKQLENLAAQQAAYEEQARLEREKGKKADEDKIKDYENSARDAADSILDMQGQLSEYFTGTDLTSAAKDFANSWIEAYKEFGSTTDAMKEKFQDMVQSMIEQSLGAKIMQSILKPLFDEIDAMADEGGELSAQEIAQIAEQAPGYIDQINAAMTNLMNSLAASGYNVRQGVSGLTGISRDIAGASEESITGLAAGINTQNFYMSLISQNVAAILQSMTGGEVQGATGVAVPDSYKETVLLQMENLPLMRDDMYAIRSMLEKVIRPNGTTATHYVATKM